MAQSCDFRSSLSGLSTRAGCVSRPAGLAALLTQVGFVNVNIEPVSTNVLIGGGGTLDQSVDYLLGIGIVRGVLSHLDPDARTPAVETIRGSLANRYEPGVGVRLGAAVWLVASST
jgi:hypothetical protein